jgi:hypothetical protein
MRRALLADDRSAISTTTDSRTAAPTRSRSADDTTSDTTFLLELEFDLYILLIELLCNAVDVCWSLVAQVHDANSHGEVRIDQPRTNIAVLLAAVSIFFVRVVLWIGGRCYLQQAVRRQQISSRRARLSIVASLYIGAVINCFIWAYNFGLPQPEPPRVSIPRTFIHTSPSTPETFVWYFYAFSHLSAAVSGLRLAVRLIAYVIFVQFTSIRSIQIYRNLGAGLNPWQEDHAAYSAAIYWTEKVVELSSSLLFAVILQRFRRVLADAQELQAQRSLSQVMVRS